MAVTFNSRITTRIIWSKVVVGRWSVVSMRGLHIDVYGISAIQRLRFAGIAPSGTVHTVRWDCRRFRVATTTATRGRRSGVIRDRATVSFTGIARGERLLELPQHI